MQEQLTVAEQRLQRQAEEIQQHVAMARTDALTGLANRRAFDEHLHMRLADWRRHEIPTSLVMIDVDHFKKFNDTHGHQAGDAVLRGVAKVLVDEMRDTDLVARLGGEEIAIVLPRTELLEATRVAERGRLAIADMSINYSGQSLRVSASFGVSKIVGGDGAETLIRRADQALYAAKQNGRNKTYIDDGKGSVEADSYLESCDAPSTPAPTRPETSSNGTRPSPSTARKADRLEPAPPLAAALPNRSAFCDELRRLLAQREMNDASLVVAMFKIDNLSKFKSSHGAPAVEQISKSLVRIAGAILRRDDTLARIGENHYAISMPNQSLKDAVVSAQRLVEAVDQAREENPDQSWSISVGLASAVGADTLATLVQRGEDTLAQATGAGVGQIAVFDGTTSRLLQSTRV
jgi:diguanylate cyclase